MTGDNLKSERTARIARFYHAEELHTQTELILSKAASHHLVTVLRTRQGDVIELFNGDGYHYRATVTDTGQRAPGRRAVLQVDQRTLASTESPVAITLVQCISRGDRMDTTLRQAVELGVTHLQPVYSRYSARVPDDKRMRKKQEHWHSIVVSACEQSGRAVLPGLATPSTLTQWLAGKDVPDHSFVLSPTANQSLTSHLSTLAESEEPVRRIALIIGPESGLDAEEIDLALQAGALPTCIGPRVLRTETAGPACITLAQSILGDLRCN